jgi:hypothetical protein
MAFLKLQIKTEDEKKAGKRAVSRETAAGTARRHVQ